MQFFCRYQTNTTEGRTVAGGSQGTSATQLDYPVGLALDSSLNLYVTDTSNHRILRYDRLSWEQSIDNYEKYFCQQTFITKPTYQELYFLSFSFQTVLLNFTYFLRWQHIHIEVIDCFEKTCCRIRLCFMWNFRSNPNRRKHCLKMIVIQWSSNRWFTCSFLKHAVEIINVIRVWRIENFKCLKDKIRRWKWNLCSTCNKKISTTSKSFIWWKIFEIKNHSVKVSPSYNVKWRKFLLETDTLLDEFHSIRPCLFLSFLSFRTWEMYTDKQKIINKNFR